MESASRALSTIRQPRIDLQSLRVRLILGMAAFSLLGLGGVAGWTSWTLQQWLIGSHQQNVQAIAERLPQDIELYSEMMSVPQGLQKALDQITTSNLLIWVNGADGNLITQSSQMAGRTAGQMTSPPVSVQKALMGLSTMPNYPQVREINQRYFILYSLPLLLRGTNLGTLQVAEDITRDQIMFQAIVRALILASLLGSLAVTGASAWYVRRALQPLRQLSQMAGMLSAHDFGQRPLRVENAPTEVKELAQTCNQMLSRLWDAWEQQRQFVGNVSHELRTPLTVVHGYLQSVLKRGTNLSEPQREALATASTEAEHTIRILKDLLELARSDSGNLRFHLEPVDLAELAAEVTGMGKPFASRHINIESAIPAPVAKADRSRLKQVLLNLLDNAVKYADPQSLIVVRLAHAGEFVTIQVCDQGPGIPLQQQSRIFERFYRLDESRDASSEGCGLGLSIVKTLTEGMGGSVTVRSMPGEGSIFTVSLPSYRENL
ncbi:cell wall metabolism sensor histidine kinase WalK [Leptolyngbya sp. FACHB-261]|uniref:sensor histidine kinase n=1 Tax=Leptolyngbya sp. FACHB-261 TaxID=2692806 RepID=UPI00168308F4|nr:ATP-binding protein [Leptolyngbya sp. FACHB-261]MBD2101632.1 HAMP domain-containing protein [Leptolyngbya sp. FACHB-261]